MANIQAPFGFRPVRRIDGTAPNYQLNQYQIAYNNANTIARGDPVKLLSTGYIDLLAPGTTAIFGIFMGCEYLNPSLGYSRWYNSWNAPSGLNSSLPVVCWVVEDPNLIWQAQAGGAATAIVQGNIGNNVNFGGQGAPNSAGLSTAYLDQTTIGTTATLPFRITGLSQAVGNDNTSAYNVAEVIINFSQLKSTTGV